LNSPRHGSPSQPIRTSLSSNSAKRPMVADLPSEGSAPGPIPRYPIVQKIGTGEMGPVYLAADNKKNRRVALKLFSTQEKEKQPERLKRFKREARYGRRLRDENVAALYGVGRQGDIHYVAMEFVDGVKLDDYVKERGHLNNLQALEFIMQATRAIQHLYSNGIVHRDIKPSNFIVTKEGGKDRTKLIDFGVTHRGISGRIDYISPEQARDSSILDTRSNVYSLGCIWYHMLAGQAPFAQGRASERLQKHIEAEPQPIGQINPDVTVGCVRILSRMLAKDPLQRYADLAQLLADLRKESAVWKLTDPTISHPPAGGGGAAPAGYHHRSIRMRKGRRHFTSLEHEEKKDLSPLFPRRKKKSLSMLIEWLKGLFD